jgi:hypothetical protein
MSIFSAYLQANLTNVKTIVFILSRMFNWIEYHRSTVPTKITFCQNNTSSPNGMDNLIFIKKVVSGTPVKVKEN